ncbi:MAG: DUF2341 domain-containing protein, partial [Candidatus Aenigmarchaeota archaeon]|nr:DUF2341 domain-containing protein [Candidatus Aenigmarchaeota archaeon]
MRKYMFEYAVLMFVFLVSFFAYFVWAATLVVNEPIDNSYSSGYNPQSFIFKITEKSGTALIDHQVLLNIDTTSLMSHGKLKQDCANIRFRTLNGTQLNYWLESGCNTDNARFWIKIPYISADSVLYIEPYFVDFSDASESDADGVFDFFEGFEGTSVNESVWTIRRLPNPAVSDGWVTLSYNGLWTTNYVMPERAVLEAKVHLSGTSAELRVGACDSALKWVSNIGTTGTGFNWLFYNDEYYDIEQTNKGQSQRAMWGWAEYRTLFKYDTTKPLLYFLFDDRDNFVHSASWQDVNSPTPNTDLHLILHSYDTGGTLKVDYIFVRKLAPNGNEPDVSHADLNATVLLNATSSATATEMFYYLDEENKVTACTSCSSFQRALVPGGSTDKWWNFYWNYRVNITVNTGYMPRKANAVTQSIIDFGSVLDALGESGTIDQNSIRVVNVDGEVLPSEVLRWLTLDKAMIRFKLTENETLDKETDYKYYIYFDILEHNSKAEVKLDLPRIYAMASHGRYSYYSGEEGEWGLWQSSGAGMRKLAIADFDNDGDYDYVANVGSYVYLYENTNDDYWSFIRSTVTSHSMHYADLAVCDFNEDGNLDFATSYQNGSWSATSATHFIMLWGNGDGTFNETYIDQIDKPAYYPIGGVCGDFDGDGNMDAMMFHRRCYSTAHRAYGKVYWGDGNGNFEKDAAWVGYERASPYGGTWIIDDNQDGYDDLYQSRCYNTYRTAGPGPSRSWSGISNKAYLKSGDWPVTRHRDAGIQFDNNNDGLQDLLMVGVGYGAGAGLYAAYGTETGDNPFENPVMVSSTGGEAYDIGVPEGLRGITVTEGIGEKGLEEGKHTVIVFADTDFATTHFTIDTTPPMTLISHPGIFTSDLTPLLNITIAEDNINLTKVCIGDNCKIITNTNGTNDLISLDLGFVDFFNGNDSDWQNDSGIWLMQDEEYKQTDIVGTTRTREGDTNWENYDYSFKFNNISSDGKILAYFRYLHALSYYYMEIDFLQKKMRIANHNDIALTDWYGYNSLDSGNYVKISVNVSDVDIYINNKYLFSASISGTKGQIGLGTINGSAGFDDVSVSLPLYDGDHIVTVYVEDKTGNYNATIKQVAVDASLPKISANTNTTPDISPVDGDVKVSGNAWIGGNALPYGYVSIFFNDTVLVYGTNAILSGSSGFNYSSGNSNTDNTFSFIYNSTDGNVFREFIVPSQYIRHHKNYYWHEAEDLIYQDGPVCFIEEWGTADPSGTGSIVVVSSGGLYCGNKNEGTATFLVDDIVQGEYNLWIRGNRYNVPFYISVQTDNFTWNDYEMTTLPNIWDVFGWENKTITVYRDKPVKIKLNDTSSASDWDRLTFDAVLITDDFDYNPSVRGDDKYGHPYAGYLKVDFVNTVDKTFDLNLSGNDDSIIIGTIADSAYDSELQIIGNEIKMHEVATDQNGEYDFDFNLKNMLGIVNPGIYPIYVNITDDLNNG